MSASNEITLDGLLNQEVLVGKLVDGGFGKDEARLVLAQSAVMDLSPEAGIDFQKYLQDDDGNVDTAKTLAYSRVNSIKMTLDSYLPVLNDRADNDANYEDGTSKNIEELRSAVQMMHAAGYDAQKMAHVFNNLIKISCSYTSHPTEGLSKNGVKLTRNLVKAAESGNQKTLDSAVNAIIESDDFEATTRDNALDEIDEENNVSRIHNKGVNAIDRAVESMIFKTTGEYVEIRTNTAPRSWAYDADGKNNAEGFSMMAKMATTKMGALTDLVANLGTAKSKDIPDDLKDKMEATQNDIQKIIDRLQPIHDKSREITLTLAKLDPAKREDYYRKNYEESFKPLIKDFAKIYDDVDGGRDAEAYYHDLIGDGEEQTGLLDSLRKELEEHDSGAAFAMDESYRTMRRCGFALDRGQTRHNDGIYVNMLDNLFKSDAFWSLELLGDTDREAINTAGRYSDLSTEAQACYFDKILDAVQNNDDLRNRLLDVISSTNPLAFKSLDNSGNGYPNQARTYYDRMKLRSLFPMIFSEGVISDAQKDAPIRQKFFADLLRMEHMRHMPLHEDDKTLGNQGGNSVTYNKYGGAENIKNRKDKLRVFYRRFDEALHVMRAASDAEKTLGSFTRLQAMQQFREVVREGYKIGVPIEFMIGGGGSLNRFGGDVDMVRRIMAQELKEIIEEKIANGGEYDAHDEKMLMAVSSILYTEQGRTKRYVSATPNQIRDNFSGKMVNIIQDVLDIRGDVPSHTFIDKRHRFRDGMKAVQHNAIAQAMVGYKALTHVVKKDKDGKADGLIMDSYYDKAGCPHLVSYMNNGSRPAAGKAKGAAKGVSDLRAIGKDQTSYLAQSFHAGIYRSGLVMDRFHDRLHANKGATGSANEKNLNLSDINDLMNQPDWDEAIFSRNLIDAGRFNASQLLNQISDKNWSFDRIVELGSAVQIVNEGKAKGGKDDMWVINAGGYEDDYSEEEIYFAKIYYDRLLFLSMTEAAITPQGHGVTMNGTKDDIIKAFRPDDNNIEINLGARTNAKYPDVVADLKNHGMNAPAYSFMHMVNDDIEAKIQSGMSKNDAIATYGDGDFDKGEAYMRKICSSFRAGTMPHKSKWTYKNTYGVENRRENTMAEFLNKIFPNHRSSVSFENTEPV